MIYSELYSAYYNAVAAVLKKACSGPVAPADIRRIAAEKAFGESVMTIESALTGGRWPLLKADGTTPLRHAPTMPLTTLQRRWLKALSLDPRIRLFPGALPDDPETPPLFRPEDIRVFDRYTDGDPYEDENYIALFRQILDAVKTGKCLKIEYTNRNGPQYRPVCPERLEYSEKDDKFRLAGTSYGRKVFINLSRIERCRVTDRTAPSGPVKAPPPRTAEMEVFDRRNALERVLMHFAHFEKRAERLDGDRYRVLVTYEKEDETEMVIRILSFGPLIRVLSPDLKALVRDRILRQIGILKGDGDPFTRRPDPRG